MKTEAREQLQLVWTGPGPTTDISRDTSVVVRDLFASARSSVLVAGYSFDHAREILAPLHASMCAHGFKGEFFVNLSQNNRRLPLSSEEINAQLAQFVEEHWCFGAPYPTLHYDTRLRVSTDFLSLHAKCVIVDEKRCLISSANFTDRGQTRNIEAGVLIDDTAFSARLLHQFRAGVGSGAFTAWRPGA